MAMPALFTRMSIGPRLVRISPTTRSTSAGFDTSRIQPCAAPPAAVISSTTVCTRSAPRSTTATLAPSSAKRCAVARPMPLAAPVTIATRPAIDRFPTVNLGITHTYQLRVEQFHEQTREDEGLVALHGVARTFDDDGTDVRLP